MKKGFREGERLLREMGFTILGSGRSKHHFWILRTPGGREFKQPIPHDTSECRFWNNWKMQLRRRLNEEAGNIDPRSNQHARR